MRRKISFLAYYPKVCKISLKSVVILASFFISVSYGGAPLQNEFPVGIRSEEEGITYEQALGNGSSVIVTSVYTNEETYRLPRSVLPYHYNLEIRPILDSDDPNQQFTAPGRVEIFVKCVQSTSIITLHSKEIKIEHSQVTVADANSAEQLGVYGYSVDPIRSFYRIHLTRNLSVNGDYKLTIPFTSLVAQNRLNGLYLSSYNDTNGRIRYLATTQFEKADASKAFPCFDEPSTAFRSTFTVKIGRKADTYHSLFNTENFGNPVPIAGLNGWVWDRYATTVSMPVYLVAIIVSDFNYLPAAKNLFRRPVRTWAPPPLLTAETGKFSAEAAARMLGFLEKHFEIPYPMKQLDAVAIPDFAPGAMENLGLVTFRTKYLIWSEDENTQFEKWSSASIIGHELTHQWFGNLVTCNWWNEQWLNEGFARFFETVAAAHSGAHFRAVDRYVIETTQVALEYDERDTTEPVRGVVTDRVKEQSSKIVYEKAAALIRMMQSFLTEETLIKGLRVYLKRHAYSGVDQDDLFDALTEQARMDGTFTQYTVKEIMDLWLSQSGFPIVRVSRAGQQKIYISQKKFRRDPLQSTKATDNSLWYIPISYVVASNPDFSANNTRPKTWMAKNLVHETVAVDSTNEWIVVNPNGIGFYRVIYDNYLTQLILAQLEVDHTVINFASRSQLIDDYFKSALAKYVSIQSALDFTRYLSKENDYIVWTTVVNNLHPFLVRLEDTNAFKEFSEYMLSLVIKPLQKIGVHQNQYEPAETTVLRTFLLDIACSLGHQICQTTAERKFAEWIGARDPPKRIPIATDLQPMLYCGAVSFSADRTNTTIQDFLMKEYTRNRSTRQQSTIVNALACDQVKRNLQRLMEKAIDTSASNELNVAAHGFQLLQNIARNSVGRQLLLNFMVNRRGDITAVHGTMAIPNLISTIAPFLSSQSVTSLPAQVEAFVNDLLTERDLTLEARRKLESTLVTIRTNSECMDYFYKDIKSWLSNQIQVNI